MGVKKGGGELRREKARGECEEDEGRRKKGGGGRKEEEGRLDDGRERKEGKG
jgi:hypothetical protein